MGDERGRARRRWTEGAITTAVLTLVFLACAAWGVGAGWGTSSIAALLVGAALSGTLTVRSRYGSR